MVTCFAALARRGALRILFAAALVAMVALLEEMPVQAQPSLIEFDAPGRATDRLRLVVVALEPLLNVGIEAGQLVVSCVN